MREEHEGRQDAALEERTTTSVRLTVEKGLPLVETDSSERVFDLQRDSRGFTGGVSGWTELGQLGRRFPKGNNLTCS